MVHLFEVEYKQVDEVKGKEEDTKYTPNYNRNILDGGPEKRSRKENASENEIGDDEEFHK